jgi:hypothetical protein
MIGFQKGVSGLGYDTDRVIGFLVLAVANCRGIHTRTKVVTKGILLQVDKMMKQEGW